MKEEPKWRREGAKTHIEENLRTVLQPRLSGGIYLRKWRGGGADTCVLLTLQ